MKFIASRDLRIKPGQVWKDLKKDRELVVTSHGRPIALITPVSEENLEERVRSARASRLGETIRRIQKRSVELGLDKMTMEEIDAEVQAARKERHG